MTEEKIKAEFDYAGSEGAKYFRWIFKGPKEEVVGAIHILKGKPVPNEVTIQLSGGPDNVSER